MIIKRIPSFLRSPQSHDYFEFSKDGRFVFVRRDLEEEDKNNPIFMVYDVFFNRYVKLTANSSISNIKLTKIGGPFGESSRVYLPVSVDKVLLVYMAEETSILLVLIGLNFEEGNYGLLDQIPISNCQIPELTHADDSFGLFFLSTNDGDWTQTTGDFDPNSYFTLLTFTINGDKIELNSTGPKKFNFQPESHACCPLDFYVCNQKLWFIRREDSVPFGEDYNISYFDLNENTPTETRVSKINLNGNESPDYLFSLQWQQQSLIAHIQRDKLSVFDLQTCEWLPERIGNVSRFYRGDSISSEKADAEWVVFNKDKNAYVSWVNQSIVYIDNKLVITAINRKSGNLHRIPLRNPFKLIDIAWTCALNAGVLSGGTHLLKKLPYSHKF